MFCLDNFATSRRERLLEFFSTVRFILIHEDVRGTDWLKWLERWDAVDTVAHVYHLACPASPLHYQRDPRFTIETAFLGTRNVLDYAEKSGARILIASTSEVYGDPEVVPQPESYVGAVNPVGIRSCYDEGKRAAEALAFAFLAKSAVDFRIARIFNTYGPGMEVGDGRLLPNLITQALAGEPVTITGDGSQTRSFCYVDDTVDGLIRFMNVPKVAQRILNIGNPDERTILSVASDVLRCVGRPGDRYDTDVAFCPATMDDPQRRCPDITLARQNLNWTPSITFEDGLKRTVEWFRTHRNG